jgi:RNA polymerase sigma factor (sigma-70 family)
VTVDERDWLADRFETHRAHLRAVAYRMLGSLAEADDAVQEAWLRLNRSDTGEIRNLGGWLTTVVARVSLDMLRSRRSRREEPPGAHLPDPIISSPDGDPETEALLAGDFEGLLAVLDPDVVLRVDDGTPAVALTEIHGADAVAGQALMFSRFAQFARPALINGAAGLVTVSEGQPIAVMAMTVVQGRIVALDILADPERLRRLDLTILD